MTGISRRSFFIGSAVAGVSTFASARTFSLDSAPVNLFGPASGIAKLNANENPYGPSPKALKAIVEASAHGAYYVRGSAQRLREMIAERHGLSTDYVVLSSGSSGVLTYLALAASQQGKILAPDLFWDTTSLMGVRNSRNGIVRLPKSASLSIDLEAMEGALDSDISMVHVTNPNNPTGMVLDSDELRAFCSRASEKCTVLVDEAYNELTADPATSTMVPLVKAGKNVAVARTFSKIYGLAGMRIGYMIAKPELLEKVKQYGLGDYGLNQAGVAAAVASYNDSAFLEYSKAKIIEAREMVSEALQQNGLTALPSETNFMFVNLGVKNAESFRKAMADRNVLIRGIYRDYTHWSRVSMGKLEDVQQYVDALPVALELMA
ncbi:MAG: histidinol-phosphate transaminase [Pseudomonadota bacterium]|nr:histidinol-phosphate transaminase [Pseudomonadota bacterium]MEC8633590.1 histidinol-phosphate transaminase [Pseudomonadota bacterium]